MIRNRTISPLEVTERYIEHAKTVNPDLNALVVELFDEALERAEQLTENIQNSEELPLFYGVPVSIKEMISVENQPITCGSVHRREAVATSDAHVVENIKGSGAVPLGLTNIPELGLWIESTNPVYGTTKNPHDLTRTSGGSSGGEAALIAAGASPIGIGSDMAGSIRIPAAFCGIYGHKPSTTTVSNTGHFPNEFSTESLDVPQPELVSIGPLARHASDLLPLLDVLRSGPETSETPYPEESSELLDFSDMTAYLLPEPEIMMTRSTSHRMSMAVERAGEVLAGRGASVKAFPRDFFRKATPLYFVHLDQQDLPPLKHLAGGGENIGVIGEFIRKMLARGRHTLPLLTMSLMESVFLPSADDVEKTMHITEKLRNELNDYLDPNSVLIMPPYSTTAPYHGRTMLRPLDLMYSGVFNVLDFPATAAPISYNNGETPAGVQVIAPRNRDEISIATAMAFEEELGTPDPAS